jgi:hypothetical protein
VWLTRIILFSGKSRFLLPSLQIQAVLEHQTITKRCEALKKMPRKLHDAFDVTLDRIKRQGEVKYEQAMNYYQKDEAVCKATYTNRKLENNEYYCRGHWNSAACAAEHIQVCTHLYIFRCK